MIAAVLSPGELDFLVGMFLFVGGMLLGAVWTSLMVVIGRRKESDTDRLVRVMRDSGERLERGRVARIPLGDLEGDGLR